MKTKLALLGLVGLAGAAAWFWVTRPQPGPDQAVQTESTRVVVKATATGSQVNPELAGISEKKVSARLRPVLGLDGGNGWDRIHAQEQLGENLAPEECRVLMTFLRNQPEPGRPHPGAAYALRNGILNTLTSQANPPAGLGQLLVDLHRDPAVEFTLRDYALQHLAAWYERAETMTPPALAPAERIAMRETLWEALRESDSSLAGTALLGLRQLAGLFPEFDRQAVAATALELAQNPATGELSRITALQVCAELKVLGAAPVIETLAQAAPSLPLQVAAVAALGALGQAQHAALLTDLERNGSPRLRPAVQLALRQINQKAPPSLPP